MLAKLLKYDLKSTKKQTVVLLFIVLGATVLGIINEVVRGLLPDEGGSFIARAMIGNTLRSLEEIAFLVLAGIFTASVVLMLWRFYQSTATDEAYLTFTLPAKTSSILLSKYLAEIIRCAEILLSAFVGGFLILFTQSLMTGGVQVEEDLEIPGEFWAIFWAAVVLAITYALCSMMTYDFAIFTGSVIAKKQKLLAAIGMIFLFHFVTSILVEIFVIGTVVGAFGTDGASGLYTYVTTVLWIASGVCVLLGTLFFFLTERLMRKKLNLA